MEVHVSWFGISWFVTTLVGLACPTLLMAVALGPVRKRSDAAVPLFVLASLAMVVGVVGEFMVRGVLSAALRSAGSVADEVALWALDVWTVGRPLIEGVAFALVAVAVWRLCNETGADG